ncbi:hypothetical protein CLAIMM_01585 isoform 2 [Cladophialophora immunda]|nr:hypothetical protein CLAIMM_01585 isoform 2 [Cladophialophora immunda]
MASQFHKQLLFEGNGTDYPRKGDEVSIEYTGWLYDASKPDQDYKGDKFDSSVGRGAFKTQIGVGRVIEGIWRTAIVVSRASSLRMPPSSLTSISKESMARRHKLFSEEPNDFILEANAAPAT